MNRRRAGAEPAELENSDAMDAAFVPPARRREALVHAAVDDEVLIYDEQRHQAHALNAAAAEVLEHCDGQHSVQQMARQLAAAQKASASLLPPDLRAQESWVWLALLQLDRARLLQDRLKSAAPLPTRRDLLRRLARGALALPVLPVVASVVAPTAMEAASCSLVSCASKPCCISKLCSGPPLYLCV